jgi:hypothetical protein
MMHDSSAVTVRLVESGAVMDYKHTYTFYEYIQFRLHINKCEDGSSAKLRDCIRPIYCTICWAKNLCDRALCLNFTLFLTC